MFAIIHEEIDLIGLKGITLRERERQTGHNLLWTGCKYLQVVAHILEHVFKEGIHLFIRVFFLEGPNPIRCRFHEQQAIHLFCVPLDFFLQIPQFKENLVYFFPQRSMLGLHLLKFFFWKPALLDHFLNLIDVHGISIYQGHDLRPFDLTDLNVHKGEALISDPLVELFKETLPLLLIFFHYLLFPVDIFLALEQAWHFFFQGFYEVVDVLPELLS